MQYTPRSTKNTFFNAQLRRRTQKHILALVSSPLLVTTFNSLRIISLAVGYKQRGTSGERDCTHQQQCSSYLDGIIDCNVNFLMSSLSRTRQTDQ